jgi:hypothetical protein
LSRNLSVRGGYEFQSLATSSNFSGEPAYSIKPNGFTVGLGYRQGNRISKHLQQPVEKVVIPACTLELSAQGAF